MVRIKFNRASNFNLDDHLFRLKIEKINKEEPFLIDVMDDLSSILENAIKYLQNLYSKNNEHHIYIAFSQQSAPVLGITSGKPIKY